MAIQDVPFNLQNEHLHCRCWSAKPPLSCAYYERPRCKGFGRAYAPKMLSETLNKIKKLSPSELNKLIKMVGGV